MISTTAIDEYSRRVFREMYDEHSTCSFLNFLIRLIQKAPFPICEIQTDNETDWTKALISENIGKTLVERIQVNGQTPHL